MYQRAVGWWAATPQRKVLWALHGVLHKLEKAAPEQAHIDEWADTIAAALYAPVESFDWSLWYAEHTARESRVIGKRFVTVDEARELGREALANDPELRARADAYERRRGFVRIVRDNRPELPDELKKAWDALPDVIKEQLWQQAGEMRAKAEGLPFNPEDLAKGLAATFQDVKGITDTTADALRRMMQLALEEGDGQFGFARTLKREMQTWSTAKSRQVAVTEWNRAASTATVEGYRAMGIQQKVWITLGDNRVCDDCEENSAMGPVPINSAFFTGDDSPPAHPSCRCSVASA